MLTRINKDTAAKWTQAEAFTAVASSFDGLSESEARSRLVTYGPNTIKNTSKQTLWQLIVKQFKSSLIYLLIAACTISFLLRDFSDSFIILIILLLNTGLGLYQEYKSELAVEKLQKLVSKEVLVKREAKEALEQDGLLVPGDIVVLREGDVVPADIWLLSTNNLTVNESQLTGESMAVSKVAHKKGSASLAFAGSVVEQGEGQGIVYSTAAQTELGKIASLSASTIKTTQYEQSLAAFSSFLIKVTFLTLLLVFILKVILNHNIHDLGNLAVFIVVLAISVVPEALPVIATVTLSRGALKLANQHVIAKTLSAVEDLGNINILCSDKTGTLTENKQVVMKLIAADTELFQRLAIASLETLDEKRKKFQSAFDRAFLEFVPQNIQSQTRGYVRLQELPFDPAARRRRAVFRDGKKTYLVEVGSVETLLKLTGDKHSSEYSKILSEDGKQGLRHLGIAYREVTYSDNFNILEHEHHLTFAGFVALEDRLRPSAKHTIELARQLGVDIKILSGDSSEVTGYVAAAVGLLGEEEVVYNGEELDAMSDSELAKIVQANHAFARLNPEQKYRIIKLLKSEGNVVGYQGDGINDAPALKLADVAIAVNNATDVAQDSADILLLYNDISVIINGIRYGRAIFTNINKYIRYTMIGNFGNFFALSALYLLSASLPLLTIQLLLTNLLGDLPLITIATDNVGLEELARPSKYNTRALLFISMFLGSFTALFELFFFAVIKSHPQPLVQTSLYLYLTVLGFVIILAVRNRRHFWQAVRLSGPLKLSFAIIGLLSVALIYFPPTKHLFSFVPLPVSALLTIAAMTVLYLGVLDTIKVWFYKSNLNLIS